VRNKLAAVIVEAELLRDATDDPEGMERLIAAVWQAQQLPRGLDADRRAPRTGDGSADGVRDGPSEEARGRRWGTPGPLADVPGAAGR
jgi:hypothetical protein